jgi:hypothetical protein
MSAVLRWTSRRSSSRFNGALAITVPWAKEKGVPNRTASASPAKGCREQYRPALLFGARFGYCFPTFKGLAAQVRGFAESSSVDAFAPISNCHGNFTSSTRECNRHEAIDEPFARRAAETPRPLTGVRDGPAQAKWRLKSTEKARKRARREETQFGFPHDPA